MFLEVNDVSVSAASNAEVYDLVMAVASSSPDLDTIADQLERLHARGL